MNHLFLAIALLLGAPRLAPPALLSDPTVAYPEGATGDATVVLVIVVGEDGAVRSATPESGGEPFAAAAARAATAWRFEPATRDGKRIAARIKVTVSFTAPRVVETPAPKEEEPKAPPPPPRPGAPRPIVVEEVRVRGDRPEPSRTVTLSRAEVRLIPGTFGDPFRAIEAMPGVTPVVSGLPFFFIRGAPPGNVGYFLDGVRVPLLFHVGAGPSVVHPGLIDRVDLYPGGYPARFGRFAGGIVAGETLPPSTEPRVEYNVRAFDAGGLLEVPFAKGKGSLLAGGRYSYTAALFSLLSPETTLNYWDYQARLGYDLTPDDRVTAFAFGSYDYLGQRTQGTPLSVFGAEFHRLDLRYDRRLPGGTLRTAVTLGLDRSQAQEDRSVRTRVAGVRTELTQRISPRAIARVGADVMMDTFDVEIGTDPLAPSTSRIASAFPSRSDLAAGVRADVIYGVSRGFEVIPGARVDYFASGGATAVAFDPRLAFRTAITPRSRLLSAMGLAHQPPSFVLPVPGFQPGGLRGGLQKAVQQSVGVEVDLDPATIATASVFYNSFFDMSDPLSVTPREISGCPPGSFPAGSLAGDPGYQPAGNAQLCGTPRFPPGTIGPDRSGGGDQGADSRGNQRAADAFEVRTKGSSFGLELLLKRRLTSKLGGFVSYTLSRSVRITPEQRFVATFDRTHVASVALAYDLGKRWRVGGRVLFYTGLPKAPDPVDPSADRLPPFFRLDLRIEKRWQLGTRSWISAVAEWMNVTLSKEAVTTRCTLQGCEAQEIGPVTLPSLGIEGGF